MASFTDSDIKLTPYVAQQPIEAMRTAGMLREQQFQEGIQTVQSMYNSLLALPIAKRETQDYVKEKVDKLNSTVKQSISGDFSNQRLINQIGGLAGQISNDPVVQNGVQSTAKMQAGLTKAKADQERAMKEGKNPTNNVNDFNDRINSWLSDGDVNSSFGDEYTPYIDVVGEIVKLYKDQNPSENIAQDAIRINKEGKVEVNPTLTKGVSPERIQSVINLVMNRGDVRAQLGVDGRQTYKGYTPEMIASTFAENTNSTRGQIEAAIRKLQVQAATDVSVNKKDINDRIKELKDQGDALGTQFTNDMKFLQENPEGFKAELVKREISDNFTRAFTTQVLEENPAFNQSMKLSEFALKQQQFEETKRMNDHTIAKDSLEYELKLQKAKEDAKNGGISYTPSSDIIDQSLGEKTEQTAREQLNSLQSKYDYEFWNQANQLARAAGLPMPGVVQADGSIIPNVGNDSKTSYGDAAQARMAALGILQQAAAGYLNGQPSDLAKQAQEVLTQIADNLSSTKQAIENIDKKYAPQMAKIKDVIKNDDYYSIYIIQKHLPGWEAEVNKMAKKYGNGYTDVVAKNIEARAELSNVPGGNGPFDSALKYIGINPSEYRKATSGINPADLSFLQTRAEDFKNIQGVYNTKAVQLNYTKDAEELPIKQKFENIIRQALLDKSPVRGNAHDLEKAMDVASTPGHQNEKSYFTGFDQTTGKGYIEVRVGGKSYRLDDIPESAYYATGQFDNLRPDNTFDAKFGHRLSTTNWITTDPGNKGIETAYLLPTPASSDYSVQYHLVQGNQQGTYNIRVWIKSKKTGKFIDGGNGGNVFELPGDSGSATNLDRAGVLDWLEKLKNPALLKSYDLILNSK